MKDIIKVIFKKFGYQLDPYGRIPVRVTDELMLKSLIGKLHPQETEHGLIRFGPDGDGGYLIPDDLSGIGACFSPGVHTVSRFEVRCANIGMQVFLADHSVQCPTESHVLFHFSKKFIGAISDEVFMTMDDWVSSVYSSREDDLLLQMDIEGFEYETILNMSDGILKRFRIIVIEFHDLDQLWNRPFFAIASRVFVKLLQTHTCLHIHPNNRYKGKVRNGISIPPLMEFTFLRTDRIERQNPAKIFPHKLDFDNTSNKAVPLPKDWYQGTV